MQGYQQQQQQRLFPHWFRILPLPIFFPFFFFSIILFFLFLAFILGSSKAQGHHLDTTIKFN